MVSTMIDEILFKFARRYFTFLLSFSGFDLLSIYKYKSKSYKNHPKLTRYKVKTHQLEETIFDRLKPLINAFLYVFYVIYFVIFILEPTFMLLTRKKHKELMRTSNCLKSYINDESTNFEGGSLSCFAMIVETKIMANPEILDLHICMLLESILGRLYCYGLIRMPDISELRSLFDRHRELTRLECCVRGRLKWFENSIILYSKDLIELANCYSCQFSSKDNQDLQKTMIRCNYGRLREFSQNPSLIIPREFNEMGWRKLKLIFTKNVIAIGSTYSILLILSHYLVTILFKRVKCKILPNCQIEKVNLVSFDWIEYILFIVHGNHMMFTHIAFPIIIAILQYCHNELLDGWRKLIVDTIQRLDSIENKYNKKINGLNQSEKLIESDDVSFVSLIKSSIYQLEIERIAYAYSICLRIPMMSAMVVAMGLLIMVPGRWFTIGSELGLVLCFGCFAAGNIYLVQCSMAAAKVSQVETLSWSLVARNLNRNFAHIKSHHLSEQLSSVLWRRKVLNWYDHGRFLYSPHPFGMEINYQFVIEANFYILSGILLVEKFFELAKG